MTTQSRQQIELTDKRWKAMRIGSWIGMAVGMLLMTSSSDPTVDWIAMLCFLLPSSATLLVAAVGAYWTNG